jgi:hypothetical protein
MTTPSELPVKIVVGSAPEWLVTRYRVDCIYSGPEENLSCGSGEFGAGGGISEGFVTGSGTSFPDSVHATIIVDFQPDTGLKGLVKSFSIPIEKTGGSLFFEPNQAVQRTNLIFDLHPGPSRRDYLIIKWNHSVDGELVTAGQKTLVSADLEASPTQFEIAFIPDPIHTTGMRLEIGGTLRNRPLVPFDEYFELSEKAILLRAERDREARAFRLVAS